MDTAYIELIAIIIIIFLFGLLVMVELQNKKQNKSICDRIKNIEEFLEK